MYFILSCRRLYVIHIYFFFLFRLNDRIHRLCVQLGQIDCICDIQASWERWKFTGTMYTHARLWFPPSFLAVNHHNDKNWVSSILTDNLWLIFMWMKKKKKNWRKKFKMADSKKLSFSTTTKSWAIFANISQMDPWVIRINWRKGHPFCSTYMVVRLSDVSLIYC